MSVRVLDRFFKSRTDGERVIGSYLYPICLLGEPEWGNPDSPVQVVASATADTHEVLITRMGGLFVRPPEELSNPYEQPADAPPADDLQQKIAFEEVAAEAFNKVICELCLLGVISQPTSPVHVSFGQLIEGHALVVGGSGGRETYLERTSGPNIALLNETWRMWRLQPAAVLADAVALRRSARLASISPTLPSFVAGAYSLYSQRQTSEALSDSWVVCEQLLNYLWDDFCGSLGDSPRQRRLKGARSANLRLEVLETAQFIPESLAEALQLARGRRNSLMHHARTGIEAARDGVEAMKAALEHVLGEEVADTSVSTGVTW